MLFLFSTFKNRHHSGGFVIKGYGPLAIIIIFYRNAKPIDLYVKYYKNYILPKGIIPININSIIKRVNEMFNTYLKSNYDCH